MASSSNKSTQRKTSSTKSGATRAAASRKIDETQLQQDRELFHEIGLIALFIVMVLLFLCNFGIIGPVGNGIRDIMFGIFGFLAYLTPILAFLLTAFWFANEGSPTALRKLIAGIALYIMAGVVCELIAGPVTSMETYDIKALYDSCSLGRKGGGVLAGSLAYLLYHSLEMMGTILVVLLCSAISLILLTERSLLSSMREGSERLRELSVVDPERFEEESERRRESARLRREEQERLREERGSAKEERARRNAERAEERRLRAEEKENEKILRMEKKVSGVMMDTSLKKDEEKRRSDLHEITYQGAQETGNTPQATGQGHTASGGAGASAPTFDFDKIRVRTMHQVNLTEVYPEDEMQDDIQMQGTQTYEAQMQGTQAYGAQMHDAQVNGAQTNDTQAYGTQNPAAMTYVSQNPETQTRASDWEREDRGMEADRNQVSGQRDSLLTHEAERIQVHKEKVSATPPADNGLSPAQAQIHKDIQNTEKKAPKKYMFPPLSRLQKGAASSVDSTNELKETAMRLQQTLNNFGVKVTITDISQGPSVTRYELQPEQGVKVSKIVGLTDDIKLNLAATDIRIEAPIPGKAAIGIEVPNKENMTVALRDLFESKEFKDFPSNIAFAVGKDIAGKTVVADIAKMPHMLIAGATGSGKSVCINTLIMSILYKAHPDDVKLIMVDPKVVELSVYNGIPHLLIPVVTDPKKASAALHWAVSEMEDRYRKFADYNVRDLKGYNKKLETMRENGDEDAPSKLPQIVIIVDELADLMMVSPGEVEESICRLAQLARACGIHLIIATQRPSVDVITGLIKANMPSRVAFAVSSGVDSRTILDMVGAEKLLGKGDMLFYPQGYTKPARIQGAFVSDKEVSDVVDFLKNQMIGNVYAEDIEEKIKNIGTSSGSGAGGGSNGGDSGRDEYFAEAGRFVIDKDKASIGMLQRVLKIGFNRAARIMDQLCEYGVVGEEEGTKPRKVLMSPEQFEQLLEEI
ncbi:MAG: DNA translocase FtsK [Muribaculum sp.]|nr:DNA translocase FtsK [Muribaculum sp.]